MIVDAHTHVTLDWNARESIKGLETSGVNMVVATPAGFPEVVPPRWFWYGQEELPAPSTDRSYDFGTSKNKRMKSLADEFPRIVIPYCTVNPLDGEKALEELRRCVKEDKIRGLKLHPYQQNFSMMGKYMLPVLKEAAELDIPVMFHDATLPWICPTEVAYMAKLCPDTTMILGHSGWQDHWRKAIRAAKLTDNILCCTAGIPIMGIQSILKAVGTDRVVFGSDYPCGGVRTQIYELSKVRALVASEEEKKMILGKNILRILNP